MYALRINLFGRLCVRYEEQVIHGLQHRRAQEVLSYLLLHRDRAYPRETLATLLWEDAEPGTARKYLRQALWQIKRALQSAGGIPVQELLTIECNWITLNTVDCYSLDVAEFEHACQTCHGVSGSDLSDAQRDNLERAVQLYRGDLLEGWYQDWCIFERERLQNCHLAALDKLVRCFDAQGQLDPGLAHAERILRCDPAEEQTHYHMMHLQWISGHRTKALRQYQRCKQVLLEELGVQPSERTTKLYEDIQSNRHNPSLTNIPALPSQSVAARIDNSHISGLTTYFQQLHTELVQIEEQIKRDISAVVLTLKNLR